ncbi:MAG TPA: hypothetical protein VF210_09155 [Pseudomonadales bacterium]
MSAGAAEPVRIAMWSGPRNISTAMMRAWENRDDCVVVDEPFYACYLHATDIAHPMREAVLASQPHDWQAVIEALTAPLPPGIAVQYQKHMTHHMVVPLDAAWLGTVRHAFLIRDPVEIVASYARKRESVAVEDLGLLQEVDIYRQVRAATGQAPPVIEAADVLRRPEAALRALCEALGVPFSPKMLRWPPGLRASDGVWAPHWYDSVARSTGFEPYRRAALELPEPLAAVAEACRPHYEHLRALKLHI